MYFFIVKVCDSVELIFGVFCLQEFGERLVVFIFVKDGFGSRCYRNLRYMLVLNFEVYKVFGGKVIMVG